MAIKKGGSKFWKYNSKKFTFTARMILKKRNAEDLSEDELRDAFLGD